MAETRASSVVAAPVQWLHCAHENTALLPGGGVQLSWQEVPAPGGAGGCEAGDKPMTGGLVFDPFCVGYRSLPASGALVELPPGAARVARCPGPYVRPGGLAVDAARRLYVADRGARQVVVLDLERRRLLRRLPLGPARPLDAAAHCGRVLVLLSGPAQLVWLEGRRSPRRGPALVAPRCPAGLAPCRIAAGPLVLWTTREESVVARPDGTVELELGPATDLDLSPDGDLVVAGAPGRSFRRFRREGDGWVELEPVGAPGYDGGAVAHTPAGRIAYTTASGIATTTGPAVAHAPAGKVISYRLDSGHYRTSWGRVFLDACLPPRSALAVRFVTSDQDTVADPRSASPPARPLLAGPQRAVAASYPPLPSVTALEGVSGAKAVFRRPTGSERGWTPAKDGFATYEAPVLAPPGRYLWFELTLTGTDKITPQVRAVRVERPGHQLLNSLPKNWSRSDADADFLQRYLAPVEGVLHELDWRSAQRAVLLDPHAAPADKLDWLASFAGLVLDQRWSERARRSLVAEAYPLFARRGTKDALVRMLTLYLEREPRLVEQWQLRGLGGTVLGIEPVGPLAPRVEGSTRLSGSLGRFTLGGRVVAGAGHQASGGTGPATVIDSYQGAAHRCTVLVPGRLTDEQREVVASLLETHRPAHVKIDLCELGAGMRVGVQLRVDLSSYVGPGTRWSSLVLGASSLGTDQTMGSGVGADTIRVGDSRVGARRVG